MPRAKRKFNDLLDADARETLQRAATAVGMNVEQLADLLVDSGAVALPPSDGTTQLVTLAELGKRMWTEMEEQLHSRRPAWFNKLLPVQQNALVVVLREQGFPITTIARELALEPLEVGRIYHRHADELGSQVISLRLSTIAGSMQIVADKAQQLAIDKGDHRTYWSIEKDKIKILQSLGILERAAARVEHTHRFDEQQREEIEAMLDLERKQKARLEEIKQADFEVQGGDPVPAIEEDYDDGVPT